MTAQPPQRYFIALVPPPALCQEIAAIQQHFAESDHSRKALNSPPHLTVQPPFTWPRSEQARLAAVLGDFARQRSPFPLQLNGFGAFPPRVIFLQPAPNPALVALQQELRATSAQSLGLESARRGQRPFRPHVTVAYRDLTPAAFRQAWPVIAARPFQAEFLAAALTLLAHDGQRWQMMCQLPLGTDRAGSDRAQIGQKNPASRTIRSNL